MKYSSLGLLLSLSLVGCYRPLGLDYADGGSKDGGGGQDGGTHDGGVSCNALDQAACAARSDCAVVSCPSCDPKQPLVGCIDKGQPAPLCPTPICAPCSQRTDAASCVAAAGQGCYVFDCCGFVSCLGPEDEPMACGADCIANCGDIKDEANCSATPYCHNVYFGCPSNAKCSDVPEWKACSNYQAACTAETLCDAVPPTCPPGHVPGIANGCYEGCVKQEACCPTACDAGSTCQQCWTDYTCLPDGAVC